MGDLIGKTIKITGMIIEIVSDEGESCKCYNFTTKETLVMKKEIIEKAIKLGKAEVISSQDKQ